MSEKNPTTSIVHNSPHNPSTCPLCNIDQPNQYEDKKFSYGVDMGTPDGDHVALSVIVDGTAYIWNGKEAEAIMQLIAQKQLGARIDELYIEADRFREAGYKGLPPNFQPRMNQLQRELKKGLQL